MRTLLAREIVSNLKSDKCSILSLHKTFKDDFLESPFLKHLDEIYGGALTVVYDSDSGDGELLWSHTTKSFCIGHMSTKQKSARVSWCYKYELSVQLIFGCFIYSSLSSQHCRTIKYKANQSWFKDNISKCPYNCLNFLIYFKTNLTP